MGHLSKAFDRSHSEGVAVKRKAIIIGAGPAGLTAAYELTRQTDIVPIVLEADNQVGGISKTVNFNGNRMDIGGHRFFTKSSRALKWWLDLLPLEQAVSPAGPDPATEDRVMLVRKRLSRIYYLHRFFDYPVALNAQTVLGLGLFTTFKIGLSYIKSMLFPIKEVRNLEQLLINRFGRELYRTFFESYTEKVWGMPANAMSSDWGVQRIKDISVMKAVIHHLMRPILRDEDIRQIRTSTSLIERFMYPKFGPGQMWEEAAKAAEEKGCQILPGHRVVTIHASENRVLGVTAIEDATGEAKRFDGDYVISSMPVKDLVLGLDCTPPPDIQRVAQGLQYRDFIMVGILVCRLRIANDTTEATPSGIIPDNWIYIQERDVKIGRLQIFNNWSPYMVRDAESTVWLGAEYYCFEGDEFWNKADDEILRFAREELDHIGIIDKNDFMEGTVLRVKKSYPAYSGTYGELDTIRRFLDPFENLFLVGRNGMHRYNNQDHSMLTAMTAVDSIVAGSTDKEAIWSVNTEQEYQETSS